MGLFRKDKNLEGILESFGHSVEFYECSRTLALALNGYLRLHAPQDMVYHEFLKEIDRNPTGYGDHRANIGQILKAVISNYGRETTVRVLGDDGPKYKDLAKVLNRHGTEIRIGPKLYKNVYWQTIEGALKLLKNRDNERREIYFTADERRELLLRNQLGRFWPKLYRRPSINSRVFPVFDKPAQFRSRNDVYFARNIILLPHMKDPAAQTFEQATTFTKFFKTWRDWLKDGVASWYLEHLGMPVDARLTAAHGRGNYLTVSEFIAGETVQNLLKEEPKPQPLLEKMVERVVSIQVKGGRSRNRQKLRKKIHSLVSWRDLRPLQLFKEFEWDPETYFARNFTLRRRFGSSAVNNLSDRQVRKVHRKMLKRIPEYQALYGVIHEKVLLPLREELQRRKRCDELDLVLGDAHAGNFMVPSQDGAYLPYQMRVIDKEMAFFGLGEIDLYKIIDLHDSGIPEEDKGLKKLLFYKYVSTKIKKGEVHKDVLTEMSRTSAVYERVKALEDLLFYARKENYAARTTNIQEKARQQQIGAAYMDRAMGYLVDDQEQESILRDANRALVGKQVALRLPNIALIQGIIKGVKVLGKLALGGAALGAGAGVVTIVYEEITKHPACQYVEQESKVHLTLERNPEFDLQKNCGYTGAEAHLIVTHTVQEHPEYWRLRKGQLEHKAEGEWHSLERGAQLFLDVPENLAGR